MYTNRYITMETIVVKHDTIYSTKFPQLLSAPSGSIYRWTIIVFFFPWEACMLCSYI